MKGRNSMKQNRAVLCQRLGKICEELVLDKREKEVAEYIFNKYGIPRGEATDMVALRVGLDGVTDFYLFTLTDAIDNIKDKSDLLHEFYTDSEISTYGTSRWVDTSKASFPIRIKCIPVEPNHWIGASNVDFLMKLRNSQLINYNTNAQRTMTRIVRGEREAWKLSVNNRAVDEITEALLNGTFIPNTLTLNLSSDADFYYDEKNNELVVESAAHFDMADGYHRYLAMCRARDIKSDFNYAVELRIVQFEDTKVKQFIFQEDQKTQMRKIDSESMNMTDQANVILERLNSSVQFDLHGQIQRNGGQIDFASTAQIVHYLYVKGKEVDNKRGIELTSELSNGLNSLLEGKTELLEHKFNFREMMIILVGLQTDQDGQRIYSNNTIYKALDNYQSLNEKEYASLKVRKGLITKVENLLKESV